MRVPEAETVETTEHQILLEHLPDVLRIRQVADLLGYGNRFNHRRLHELGIPHIDPVPHCGADDANGIRGVRIPKLALVEWLRMCPRAEP